MDWIGFIWAMGSFKKTTNYIRGGIIIKQAQICAEGCEEGYITHIF